MFAFLSPLVQCVAVGHLDFFFGFFFPSLFSSREADPLLWATVALSFTMPQTGLPPFLIPSVALSGVRLLCWDEKAMVEDTRLWCFTEAGILA